MNPLYEERVYPLERAIETKGGVPLRVCGMTKLEAFTMAAMQGLASQVEQTRPLCSESFSQRAVGMAKATLDALAKEQGLM